MKKIIAKKDNKDDKAIVEDAIDKIIDDENNRRTLLNIIKSNKKFLFESKLNLKTEDTELIKNHLINLENEYNNKYVKDNVANTIDLKISNKEIILKEIIRNEYIMREHSEILDENEVLNLKNENIELNKQLNISNISFEDKHKNFVYNYQEIENTQKINWLYQNVVPFNTIGVIYGETGSGKTTLLLEICTQILISNHDAYIYYIDADMSKVKLKDIGIHHLMKTYKNRFNYAGKNDGNLVELTDTFIKDITSLQSEHKDRKYIVIEDSLNLTAAKSRGFIDKSILFINQRKLRAEGGTSIILHHTNKMGQFADTQQIIDYADYSYKLERNNFNSSILLKTKKVSRFDIQNKAFLTKDRKIIKEIDFNKANISIRELNLISEVEDLLENGEMTQKDIINNLKDIRFFVNNKLGQTKTILLLKKWAQLGKWKYEQRPSEKNAIYYSLYENNENVKNSKNCKTQSN